METNKGINLKHKIGQGWTSGRFMEEMQTRTMELSGIPDTKARFAEIYTHFALPAAETGRSLKASLETATDLCVLILCTDWCPDVIWNVPVLLRLLEDAGVPVEVLPMEAHTDTMDLFLTDGGRAQPIAVFARLNGDVLGHWGARPAYIQAVMDRFKKAYPDKTHPVYRTHQDRAYREIGGLYNAGNFYQEAMLEELAALLRTFDA